MYPGITFYYDIIVQGEVEIVYKTSVPVRGLPHKISPREHEIVHPNGKVL